jgi:hypothetical protein
MKYRVVWTRQAEDGLADAWLSAAEKRAVNTASDRIEALIETEPSSAGESREANDRILFDSPLVIRFRVLEQIKTVIVLACASTQR